MTVIEIIKDNHMCIGCGVCVVICPTGHLDISFNKKGHINVCSTEKKCLGNKCELCLKTCPFNDNNMNEDELAKIIHSRLEHSDNDIGSYHNCYVGYNKDESLRINSASGGALTAVLLELLKRKDIDYVVNTVLTNEKEPMFKYNIISSPDELIKSAKSAYYPVSLNEVLMKIKKTEGTFAITALPCFAKSIRLLCEINPSLKKKIKYVMGIVCSMNVNKQFPEYVAKVAGVSASKMNYVSFRHKDINRKANDHKHIVYHSNNQRAEAFWSDGLFMPWGDKSMMLPPCNFCDDLFAELADASYMDAWLDEYRSDGKGTSIIISREKYLSEILELICNIDIIDKELVIESQQNGLINKRQFLKKRLYIAKQILDYVPNKRVEPEPTSGNELKQYFLQITNPLKMWRLWNIFKFNLKAYRLSKKLYGIILFFVFRIRR